MFKSTTPSEKCKIQVHSHYVFHCHSGRKKIPMVKTPTKAVDRSLIKSTCVSTRLSIFALVQTFST